jgi:enolase
MKIQSLKALEVLDSRGYPTIEAELRLEDGTTATAAVPSGASTGEHEAVELRDGDKKRYFGKGVLTAVANVEGPIASALKGKDAADQRRVDEILLALDGTANKGKLGANAILAVSLAAARASAQAAKLPLYETLRRAYGIKDKEWLLPTPMFNVVNGGKHADSGLDVQEFMCVPIGVTRFKDAVRAGAEIYQVLKKSLAAMGMVTAVGDEGGFAPHLKDHATVLEVLAKAVKDAGYAGKVALSLDVASSEFFKDGKYLYEKKARTSAEMGEIYAGYVRDHGLVSIEDPLAENDWEGWKALTKSLGGDCKLIGDDLFVTNPERLKRGIKEGAANSILVKVNQIGTLTETVEAVQTAQKAGYSTVISHRSGETEDAFIADLAVALNAGAIKTGAPCRSERLSKYNRLLRIEAELGARASYAGPACFTEKSARGA